MTINDPNELALARATIEDLFGPDRWTDMANPELGSEDMGFVLAEVPGAYVNLSSCPPGVDHLTAPDNHSPRAAFDDVVLADAAAYLAEVALRRLGR